MAVSVPDIHKRLRSRSQSMSTIGMIPHPVGAKDLFLYPHGIPRVSYRFEI